MEFVAPEGARLVRILGAGSIFHVALVEHGSDTCVCKRLTPRMRDEERAHAALEREARFLDLARHPAVPTLIRRDVDTRGPFLLQSFVRGTPLARLVERGAVPGALVTSIARAALAALAEIHARPHRLVLGDLAPDDLFVGGRRGEIVFVDFGQASWAGHPPVTEERGTLPFSPPEVARGDEPWSQASDVYATAAMMAFAALGREPCRTEGPARLTEVADRGLDLTGLDGPLRAALEPMLSFDRRQRVDTAAAALAFLTDSCETEADG